MVAYFLRLACPFSTWGEQRSDNEMLMFSSGDSIMTNIYAVEEQVAWKKIWPLSLHHSVHRGGDAVRSLLKRLKVLAVKLFVVVHMQVKDTELESSSLAVIKSKKSKHSSYACNSST